MTAEADAAVLVDTREIFHDLVDVDQGAAPDPTEDSLPDAIGGYRILRLIGKGGMGAVYEAEQDRPRRTVALKIMRYGTSSRSILRRFESESQLLAKLRHPGIAQVFAAGTHVPTNGDSGIGPVPFFVMELVTDGLPITEYADEKGLSVRERVDLFTRVCDAVDHGHRKGVIHRDLKPANILVDSAERPKIIDFGVARSVDGGSSSTLMRAEVGQLLGTVQYMSPEQCEADPAGVDIRSDVYALGVVLYELLCGRLPYDVKDAPICEATRIVREESPDRPSTVNVALRGDLGTIVLKLLEKDRDRRYSSAAELKADLERFLRNGTISARPASLPYQLRMFARRNRALFCSLVSLITLLLGSLVVTTSLYLEVQRALDDKEAAERAEHEQRSIARQTERDLESLRGMLSGLLLRGVGRLGESPLPEDTASISPRAPCDTGLPGQTEPRTERFISRATETLRSLELQTAGDQELRRRLSESYEMLGDVIRIELGSQPEQQHQAYRRALDLTRVAGGVRTDGDDSAALLAGARPARLLVKLGRYEEALGCLVPIQDRCRATFEANRSDGRAGLELARVAFRLGDLRTRTGDVEGASRDFREVVLICDAVRTRECGLRMEAQHRLRDLGRPGPQVEGAPGNGPAR